MFAQAELSFASRLHYCRPNRKCPEVFFTRTADFCTAGQKMKTTPLSVSLCACLGDDDERPQTEETLGNWGTGESASESRASTFSYHVRCVLCAVVGVFFVCGCYVCEPRTR